MSSKKYSFVTFISVILLLTGFFTTLRTLVNLTMFKKYPTIGVLTINIFGLAPYSQREEDCFYPQQYFNPDGIPRSASEEEKKNEEKQQQLCLSAIKEARESAKINDISLSLLLLFLGGGTLFAERRFFQ